MVAGCRQGGNALRDRVSIDLVSGAIFQPKAVLDRYAMPTVFSYGRLPTPEGRIVQK